MIRAFIALEVSQQVRARLAELLRRLRKLDLDARLTQPEALHLTLKFLGQVPVARIDPVEEVLRHCGRISPRMELSLTSMGAFPNIAKPRVAWAGVEPTTELSRLHERIETALSPLSFSRERRPFRPHLTLARFRSHRNIGSFTPFCGRNSASIGGESFCARQVHLYQSILGPSGARYRKLASVDLELT